MYKTFKNSYVKRDFTSNLEVSLVKRLKTEKAVKLSLYIFRLHYFAI